MEPSLSKGFSDKPGLHVALAERLRLEDLIGWRFDYCMATYSGDAAPPAGIEPHRDAYFADNIAYGLNVTGSCLFSIWDQDNTVEQRLLLPGDVTAFDCKMLHSASPGLRRWNLNFWRRRTRP